VVDCRASRMLCEEALAMLLDSNATGRDDPLVRTLMSAAAIAETAAIWLDEERPVAEALLEFCADSCELAATQLAELPQDGVVRECAETCRAAADSVRALLFAAFEED